MNEKTIPRMRTIPKAYAEIKRIDPCTSLTEKGLRQYIERENIPFVQYGNKKLINLDLLFDRMSCYNEYSVIDASA